MGFWSQFAGTVALFTAVEGVEAVLRRAVPGLAHAIYWAAKAAIGLPLAIWAAWEMRARGYAIDIGAVTAGICAPAALFLWYYGDDGSGGGGRR